MRDAFLHRRIGFIFKKISVLIRKDGTEVINSRYTVDSAVFIICAFFCQFARPRCQLYAHGKLFLAKAENKNKKLKQTMLTSMLTLTWFYRMYS